MTARNLGRFVSCGILSLLAVAGASAELVVSSITPSRNANNVDLEQSISVTFDQPVMTSTFTSQTFWAFGRFSGTAIGDISFSNADQTVTLTPQRRFQAGEQVMVILSHDLRAADGTTLRTAGYSWQFQTRARCSGWEFTQIASMSNRDETNAQTRIYGGITTDFNGDGWVDIATINEVSADMRLFLNRADGSGLYLPFLRPPVPLHFEVSPNEPGDFDRDGTADFAVASSDEDRISVVLGNGDGTFAPQQTINVPNEPHGVAVLDADGDGDMDVVCANAGAGSLSLLLNNGSGVFGAPTSFDGGGNGEYGLIAADMNNDGILDLVAGLRDSNRASVLRGNGDATFTLLGTQMIGGPVWVIAAGDVNNDGNMDIASGNAFANNGGILMGNGAGGLSAAVTYPSPGHTPSSDLGDIDGDGDLDWVLSSFGGGAWRVYENNGNGVFNFVRDIDAPSNPACSALYDMDNDGDIDICLFDEIADVVVLLKNTAERPAGDTDLDGDVDLSDLARLLSNFGSQEATLAQGDVDADADVDLSDLALLLTTFGAGC